MSAASRRGNEKLPLSVKVVVDSEAIIGLSKGKVFDLLNKLFLDIYVTDGVIEEVIQLGKGRAGTKELQSALKQWITPLKPTRHLLAKIATFMDRTDREILAAALQVHARYVISSDEKMQGQARKHDLLIFSAPDIVLLAKRQGLISNCQEVLDLMIQRGYGINPRVYNEILKLANENP